MKIAKGLLETHFFSKNNFLEISWQKRDIFKYQYFIWYLVVIYNKWL